MKPFGPDRIVAGLLALQWIVLPAALLILAALRPTFDPTGFGVSKPEFWMVAITAIYFLLVLTGWICLRVSGGRRVGFIALAIVQGASLAWAASFVVRGRPMPLGVVEPLAVLIFVIARLRGWGPRPA